MGRWARSASLLVNACPKVGASQTATNDGSHLMLGGLLGNTQVQMATLTLHVVSSGSADTTLLVFAVQSSWNQVPIHALRLVEHLDLLALLHDAIVRVLACWFAHMSL